MIGKTDKNLFSKFPKGLLIVIFLFLCLTATFLLVEKFSGYALLQDKNQCWKEFAEGVMPFKESPSPVELIPEKERTVPDLVLLGARQEVKNGTRYDASYEVISYPGGDVSMGHGACTDVIIRAFRNAGIDLQQLIHEDMKENFHLYPQKWGLEGPDANIDHRRVPNQVCFLERYGTSLPLGVSEELDKWQWGDVVYWRFPNGRDHCGIISDRTGKDGLPLVIHNAGSAREEDCLLRWEIVGHFRYPKVFEGAVEVVPAK
jgi:uncharacterized protein YijF (DUF1287 family)